MPDDKHSKLADVERLRRIRWETKGPGAHRAAPARPSVDQLRNAVAKVAKKRTAKKARKARR